MAGGNRTADRACGGIFPLNRGGIACRSPRQKLCTAALVQGRRHGETHIIPRRANSPQAGEAKRLLPVGCGHHPAKFGSVRVVRHPIHTSIRGDARARPSGPRILISPPMHVTGGGIAVSGLDGNRTSRCGVEADYADEIAHFPLPAAACLWHLWAVRISCWRPP